jgi:hypothetical protein
MRGSDATTRWPARSARIQLEHDARDLDVVAGFESLGLERADDAHPLQAVLDVGQRLVVLEVVAGQQALDVVARDRKTPSSTSSTVKPRRAPGGRRGARRAPPPPRAGRLGLGRLERDAAQQLRGQLVEPWRVALEVTMTGVPAAGRRAPTPRGGSSASKRACQRARAASACRGRDEVGLGEREDPRQARQARVVELELALDDLPVGLGIRAVERGEVQDVDEQLRALDVRQEVVPRPAPSEAPSMMPGMSARMSWRSAPSSVPRMGCSVVKG